MGGGIFGSRMILEQHSTSSTFLRKLRNEPFAHSDSCTRLPEISLDLDHTADPVEAQW